MQFGKCHVCGENLGQRIYGFSCYTQKVSLDGETQTVIILRGVQEMSFCGQDCWEAMEEQITEGLHPLYQPLHMVATCSECRKPVDRTRPHYTLNVCEVEDISQPWLASMRVLDEKEIAVFCPECRVPDGDWAAASGLLEHENESVSLAIPESAKELERES